MKIKTTLLAVLTISPVAIAETYYLQKNETVSELLYNRLKITPIYKGGYLNRVLQHNNLTLEQTKSLPEGTAINLPDVASESDIIASPAVDSTPAEEPVEVTESEPVAEPEAASQPAKHSFYVGAGAAVEQMKGDIDPASFSSTYFYPQAKIGFFRESEHLLHQVEGSLSYVTFKKDQYMEGNNALVNAGLFYQILKKQNQFRWGFKVSGENTTLIVSNQDADGYKLKNPFFFSLGPTLQWQGSKVLTELNLSYLPSQTVDSDNDLKSGLGGQLAGFFPVGEKLQLGIFGSYFRNEVEDTEITKATLGSTLRWFF